MQIMESGQRYGYPWRNYDEMHSTNGRKKTKFKKIGNSSIDIEIANL